MCRKTRELSAKHGSQMARCYNVKVYKLVLNSRETLREGPFLDEYIFFILIKGLSVSWLPLFEICLYTVASFALYFVESVLRREESFALCLRTVKHRSSGERLR